MISVTTETVPGKTVASAGGIVHSQVVIGTNPTKVAKEFVSVFTGGSSIEERYANDVDSAYEEAFLNIEKQAAEMKCDAIVGLRMEWTARGCWGQQRYRWR